MFKSQATLPLVRTLLFFLLCIEEVSNAAQLFGCRLQGFDLLAQLGLLGLFFTKHLVDISHETASQ